jgi:diguanylate cyclase (GGDEF)-like protein
VTKTTRRAVESTFITLKSGEEARVTISVGCAVVAEVASPDAGNQALEEADAALYRAKQNGRNRVEIAPQGITPSSSLDM